MPTLQPIMMEQEEGTAPHKYNHNNSNFVILCNITLIIIIILYRNNNMYREYIIMYNYMLHVLLSTHCDNNYLWYKTEDGRVDV